MAEGIRFTSENSVDTLDDDDDKSKKKKSSARLGASAATLLEKPPDAPNVAEKLTSNTWDKLLAGLGLEKDSKAKEKTKAESALAELGGAKPLAETTLSDEAKIATGEQLEPSRELTATEMNGGEVVIDLHTAESSTDEGELAVTAIPEATQTGPEAADDPDEAEDPVQATSTPSPTTTGGSGGGNAGTSGGGSGRGRGGNGPPPSPGATPNPPPPPQRPIPTPQAAMPTPTPAFFNFNTAPPQQTGPNALNQLLAQQRATERAARLANHGRGEALVGGFIIGGLVEHFRHLGRERRFERLVKREHRKQNKRIEKVEFEQKLLKTEQIEQARKVEAERYQRNTNAKHQLAETARMQMAQVETAKRTAEQQEQDKAQLIDRLNAQAIEQERLEAEQLLKNSENRIETSAWHSIEVDKAGHAVQETDIAYGHEYYKERAHETGPKDVTTRDTVTGAAALTAATMQQSAQQSQQSDLGLPPMLGMPIQQTDVSSNSAYQPSKPSLASADETPTTSPASVLVLLVILAIVVFLIVILM